MTFDPLKHKINLIFIRCGERLFPEEKDITKLVEMTSRLLRINPEIMTSIEADHLPSPRETGPFFECPKCGEKTLVIYGICPGCKDAEDGKYATKLQCSCGYEEKSPKHLTQIYAEKGYDFKSGTKIELGIKTITDDGIK